MRPEGNTVVNPLEPSMSSPSVRSTVPRGGCSSEASSAYARSASRASVSEARSEEHTSELQSRLHLVCRLLLEKKKKTQTMQRRALNVHVQLSCTDVHS